MKELIYCFLACFLFPSAVALGQLNQLGKSISDLRENAIIEWAGDNSDRKEKALVFRDNCLNANLPTKKSYPRPITMEECSKEYGSSELYNLIVKSDEALKSIGWPLSLFVDKWSQS